MGQARKKRQPTATLPGFAKLKGRWQRPDGGYILDQREVNYPGSTYTLAYEPTANRLAGTYFQAAVKQTVDVFFQGLTP